MRQESESEPGPTVIGRHGPDAPPPLPPERQIFVNRNLRLSSVRAIGFDMDHTLALYLRAPFEELAFEEAKKKLLARGLPRELAATRYDASFVIRGLLVDKRRGNILKMDQHRYVGRAFHGKIPIPDSVRKKLYQTRPITISHRDYAPVDTPFSLPEIDLYAQLVDLADRERWDGFDYRTLYDEVRSAIDEAHADGSIKNRIARSPEEFLLPDPLLPATLRRMRDHGYRLFLLTNSEPAYTSLIMDRLLGGEAGPGSSWTDLFHTIVVGARKPSFFKSRGKAEVIELPGVRGGPSPGPGCLGGGVGDLERRLGCRGDQILYFGDHTYGDILKSKRVRLWRTAMVIQELEEEIAVWTEQFGQLQALRSLERQRRALDEALDGWTRVTNGDSSSIVAPAEKESARARQIDVQEELAALAGKMQDIELGYERAQNPHWGPLFRTHSGLSHFAAQVRSFACIYTSRVSNFLGYPPGKYFQLGMEFMPHELPGGR